MNCRIDNTKENHTDLDIVIMSFNRLECLKKCIDSVKKNSKSNYHLIIMDPGSKDGSREWLLENMSNEATLIFEKFRWSYAQSCNNGMRYGRSPYIALLNDDCTANEGWDTACIEAFKKDDKIGHAAHIVLRKDENHVMSAGANFLQNGNTTIPFMDYEYRRPDHRAILENPKEFGFSNNFGYAGFGIYRRDLLQRVGFLPEFPVVIYWDDSVTEDRYTVIKDVNENIEIINFGDLFKKYKIFSIYERDKEIIDLQGNGIELYTLSASDDNNILKCDDAKYIMTKKQLEVFSGHYKNSVVKNKIDEILSKKFIYGKWGKIKKIIRHKISNKIVEIRNVNGMTKITKNHSLIKNNGDNLVSAKYHEINAENMAIINIPPAIKTFDGKIDIMNYIHCDEIKFYEKYIYSENKYRKRRDKSTLCKFLRFYDADTLKSLIRVIGSYISEGHVTDLSRYGSYWVTISNSDKYWLSSLKKDFENISENIKFRISGENNKRGVNKKIIYGLSCSSKVAFYLFKELCGQHSKNKNFPNFIFNINDENKIELIKNLIKGDGTVVQDKGNTIYEEIPALFKYTSISTKLISQLTFLFKTMGLRFSIHYGYGKRNNAYSITRLTNPFHDSDSNTFVTEKEYSGYVYDLEVEKYNKFVDACGLILLHNSDYGLRINALGYDVRLISNSVITHYMVHTGRDQHVASAAHGRKCFMQRWGEFLTENRGYSPDCENKKRPFLNGKKGQIYNGEAYCPLQFPVDGKPKSIEEVGNLKWMNYCE